MPHQGNLNDIYEHDYISIFKATTKFYIKNKIKYTLLELIFKNNPVICKKRSIVTALCAKNCCTWPHNLPFWTVAVPHNLQNNTEPKRCFCYNQSLHLIRYESL